jgi:Arc/MetJ family transcription regulator
MRATITLEDELVAEAQGLTGLREKSCLVREALKARKRQTPGPSRRQRA